MAVFKLPRIVSTVGVDLILAEKSRFMEKIVPVAVHKKHIKKEKHRFRFSQSYCLYLAIEYINRVFIQMQIHLNKYSIYIKKGKVSRNLSVRLECGREIKEKMQLLFLSYLKKLCYFGFCCLNDREFVTFLWLVRIGQAQFIVSSCLIELLLRTLSSGLFLT